MSHTILEIKNLSISYRNKFELFHAVKNVSLSLKEGEILGLIGESGSGKTQLSMACLGLNHDKAELSGSIKICGDEIIGSSPMMIQSKLGSEIAMIFQNPMTTFNPFFTMQEQLIEILISCREITKHHALEELKNAFMDVSLDQPENILKKYPHQFSGGQLQRIIIALAISCKTKILIADEPTTALDVTNQSQIIKLLKNLAKKYSIGLLFISHDLASIYEIAEKIAVIRKGDIVEELNANDFIKAPSHPYSKLLKESFPIIGDNKFKIPEKEPDDQQILLKASNLSKNYKSSYETTNVLKSVNFELIKGDSLAIVGESGSGKTTLILTIIQLINQNSGTVHFDGSLISIDKRQELDIFRQNIGVVFQNPYSSLNPKMKVYDILAEPLRELSKLSEDLIKEKVNKMILEVGLEKSHLNRYPVAFSGGQRQRIAIARAFINEPKLIILDEPTASLDVTTQAKIIKLLNDLRSRSNTSFLFITHNLAVVESIASRILVMYQGEIIESGLVRDVFTSPSHEYTQLLLDSIPSYSKII